MMSSEALQPQFDRAQWQAAVAGAIALALCLGEVFYDPTQFFRSYLLAFVFWTGVAMGCMAILMLHHLVGGTWGFVIQRLLESGAKTFWLMLALGLPLILGFSRLYGWARPGGAKDLSSFQRIYLNPQFFWARAAVYFAAWIALAYFLNKWSEEQDRTGDPGLVRRLQALSGPGFVIFGLTATYASIDWVMSLEPKWFSTIYGMLYMVSEALGAMALITIALMLLASYKPLSDLATPLLFNDYGNLLLTFTMLWAYLSFSQYLIIWSGNLQDEIPWYTTRATGGWAWVAVFLIVFHFAVPFLVLLTRFVKRRMKLLAAVAAGLIVVSLVDLYWLMMPAFERGGPEFHWTDVAAPIGVGGLWIAFFISRLKVKPLLPVRDPRFEGVRAYGE